MAEVPVSIALTTKGVEATSASLNKVVNQIVHLEKAQAANIAIGNLASQVISRVTNASLSFGRESLNTADALIKNARAIGVSTTNYQKLQYAARLSGVEFVTLQTALQRMQKSIYENDVAFQKIGIDINQLNKMSAAQQFQLIGEALNKVQDPAARTALAMEIFGRQGATIAMVASEFQNLGAEAEKMGVIMDAGALRIVERFNNLLETMKLKLMAVFVNAIPQIKLFAETWLAEFKYILDNAAAIFKAMGKIITTPFTNIVAFAKGASVNELTSVQDIFEQTAKEMQSGIERREVAIAAATQKYTEALEDMSIETANIPLRTAQAEKNQIKIDKTRGVSAALFGSQEAASAISKYRFGQTNTIEKQQLDALNRIARGIDKLTTETEEEYAIL